MRHRRYAILVLLRLLAPTLAFAALLAACGDGEPPDFTPVRDSLPAFPGSTVYTEARPPLGLREGPVEHYRSDRTYFIGGTDQDKDDIFAFYQGELPKQGWQPEEPLRASEQLEAYCSAPWVSCLDYVREDVRLIISTPISLTFNPISTPGTTYHLHLEER